MMASKHATPSYPKLRSNHVTATGAVAAIVARITSGYIDCLTCWLLSSELVKEQSRIAGAQVPPHIGRCHPSRVCTKIHQSEELN